MRKSGQARKAQKAEKRAAKEAAKLARGLSFAARRKAEPRKPHNPHVFLAKHFKGLTPRQVKRKKIALIRKSKPDTEFMARLTKVCANVRHFTPEEQAVIYADTGLPEVSGGPTSMDEK